MASTRMHMHVVLADGTEYDVTADMRDMRQWEKSNKGKSFIEQPMDLGRMNFAAWCASRRAGLTELRFAEFDSQVIDIGELDDDEESIEIDGEEVEPGEIPPTPLTPGDISSSSSL